MIEGAVWLVLANAGALLGTQACHRRIRTGAGPLDAVLFVVLHLLLLSASVLAAGLTGGLTARGLGIPWTIVLGILLATGEHRRIPRPSRPDLGRWTAAAAGLVALRMLAQVWFYAPYVGDSLAYHLPKVAEWVRAGRFTMEMGTDLQATFPAGFELVETWWAALLHHDVLIELAGVEYAVLGFLAVRALASVLGLTERAAWTAATLYVLVPLFNIQSTACMNDAPVAALVIALFALAGSNAHPALMAIPVGLLLGTKPTGGFALPGVVLLWLWSRKGPRVSPASPRAAAAFSGLAAAVGAFWYLRNFVWYGDPIYPVNSPHPHRAINFFHIQSGPKWGSFVSNLSALVSTLVYDEQGPPTSVSRQTAGWGMVAFSIGAVAFVLEARRDPRFRKAAAAFVVSALGVLPMVLPDYWFGRFVLFFPAITSIAAASLAAQARPAALAAAAGAALQFATTLVPRDLPAPAMGALASMSWREKSVARLQKIRAEGDAVAVFAMLRTRTYPFYGPDFARRVVYLRPSSVRDLPGMMKREGLSVVFLALPTRQMYEVRAMEREGIWRDLGQDAFELAR